MTSKLAGDSKRVRPASRVFKQTSLLLLLLLGIISGMSIFRDSLSLLFWRARYITIPRAVGDGPRIIFLAEESQPIGVRLVGISEKEWRVSHKWVPGTQSFTLASNKTIITLGCWWDGFGVVTALPVDANGTFTQAMRRTVGLAHAPLQNQIAYQSNAAAGQHLITPPKIGARGDGYFLLLEVEGLELSSPIRDSGQSRESHPQFGRGDPKTIQAISVSTEGAAAEVGDLVVTVFAMDPCGNPDIKVDLPEGWTSLGFNHAAVLNIGYWAGCRIVTEAGQQSVTCTWTDNSTFVAEATIVVFKAARPASPVGE